LLRAGAPACPEILLRESHLTVGSNAGPEPTLPVGEMLYLLPRPAADARRR
jgi:hypothetical protein